MVWCIVSRYIVTVMLDRKTRSLIVAANTASYQDNGMIIHMLTSIERLLTGVKRWYQIHHRHIPAYGYALSIRRWLYNNKVSISWPDICQYK